MGKEKKSKPITNQPGCRIFLDRPYFWLVLLCFAVYCASIWYGYAELDDSIFIREMKDYNSDLGNIFKSFARGVFNPTNDIYYRPVFLIDFILEGHLFGTSIGWYHFTNLLFHIASVILLFTLFRKLKLGDLSAFLFAALFAVHPVLTQAVAWIPGRNDMLLAIFLLIALTGLINYAETGKMKWLALFGLLFLAALFTKETAIAFPFICLVYLVMLAGVKLTDKRVAFFLISVIVPFVLYFAVKSTATLGHSTVGNNLFGLIMYRLPLMFQYIGKALFPVNLSVYPTMEDTQNIYGVVATLLLLLIFIATKSYKNRLAIWGLLWFGVFLSPLLLVPKEMNNQIFEHRLYLPLMGLLIFFSQVVKLGEKTNQARKIYAIGAVIAGFALISFTRESYFKDPITFWSKAVEDSPHSPSAKTFLAMRIFDLPDQKNRAIELFHEAYNENPNERWLNYYLGEYYHGVDSLLQAEFHARKEIQNTNYYEANFLMAGIMFEKKEKDSALFYLEKVAALNPRDERIYNNMTMLYLEKSNIQAAKQTVERAQTNGVVLNPDLVKAVDIRLKEGAK
jgi:tetratricopeptide (TPR) repeat protein